MPIYPVVLKAVAEANRITEDGALAEHLATVVPALHELRLGYRTAGRQVRLNYTRELTEAYLLAYYPHYVRMAEASLRVIGPEFFDRSALRVCLVGAGPAPEAVAVGHRLQADAGASSQLELTVVDRANDGWTWARVVSVESVLAHYWQGQVSVRPITADLREPEIIDQISGVAADTDLVIFQNCLNEIGDDSTHLHAGVRALVGALPSGAVVVMSDLDNYPGGREALALVVASLGDTVEWLRRADERLVLQPAMPVPEVLAQHLFVRGEFPRSNPFLWRSLAFVRR